MAINYERLRSLTARELIAALNHDGFYFVRQTGAPQRYRHPDGRRVTVAPHGSGDTFILKTLKSIIERQARWNEHDLVRLRLIKEYLRPTWHQNRTYRGPEKNAAILKARLSTLTAAFNVI